MNDQELREKRIVSKLHLEKNSTNFNVDTFKKLGSKISNFIHHVFSMREKIATLNWCFANIKKN